MGVMGAPHGENRAPSMVVADPRRVQRRCQENSFLHWCAGGVGGQFHGWSSKLVTAALGCSRRRSRGRERLRRSPALAVALLVSPDDRVLPDRPPILVLSVVVRRLAMASNRWSHGGAGSVIDG